jgi:hypothetical protein
MPKTLTLLKQTALTFIEGSCANMDVVIHNIILTHVIHIMHLIFTTQTKMHAGVARLAAMLEMLLEIAARACLCPRNSA